MIRRLALILLLVAPNAGAAPNIVETVTYYTVSGATLEALRQDMKDKGPDRFWGITRWRITWSNACDVDLAITITMPQLDFSAKLPDRERRVWRAMIEALYRHEQMHAEHGRQAAREILSTNCADPTEVIDKWAARDRFLDLDTKHGLTQGVTLRN